MNPEAHPGPPFFGKGIIREQMPAKHGLAVAERRATYYPRCFLHAGVIP